MPDCSYSIATLVEAPAFVDGVICLRENRGTFLDLGSCVKALRHRHKAAGPVCGARTMAVALSWPELYFEVCLPIIATSSAPAPDFPTCFADIIASTRQWCRLDDDGSIIFATVNSKHLPVDRFVSGEATDPSYSDIYHSCAMKGIPRMRA